jgi:hypothetical protein
LWQTIVLVEEGAENLEDPSAWRGFSGQMFCREKVDDEPWRLMGRGSRRCFMEIHLVDFALDCSLGFYPKGFFPSSMKMERGDFDNNFVFGDYYLMWTHCLPVESKMIEMRRGKMLA